MFVLWIVTNCVHCTCQDFVGCDDIIVAYTVKGERGRGRGRERERGRERGREREGERGRERERERANMRRY